MSRLSDALAKAGSAILLAACMPTPAVAGAIVIPHARGETLLPEQPRKLAVYDLATLDILNALGIDVVAGVPKGKDGKGNFPPLSENYGDARYRNVGTLFEPDLAALRALGPDLIVVGGRSAKTYEQVSTIAPTVVMGGAGNDLAATTIAATRKLGVVFGVSDRAEQRITAFEAALARLHAQAAQSGTGLVLFVAGEGIAVHAPGDRFGHVYDFVGIRAAVPASVAAAAGPRPAPGSPEADAARQQQQAALAAALASAPTWLFVIDRNAATGSGAAGAVTAAELAANPAIAATAAWQAGRVIYLDPRTWYLGAGINALSKAARDTLAALHPAK